MDPAMSVVYSQLKKRWGLPNLAIKLAYGPSVTEGSPPLLDEMMRRRAVSRTINVYLHSTAPSPVCGASLRIPLHKHDNISRLQRHLAALHLELAPDIELLVNVRRHGRHIRSFMAHYVEITDHYIEMAVKLDLIGDPVQLEPHWLCAQLRQSTLWEYM